MYAFLVPFIDFRMAFFTGLGDATEGLPHRSGCMGIMAIRANGRFLISCCQRFLVNTVQGGVVFVSMALLAGDLELEVKFPPVAGRDGGVRVLANIRVALNTRVTCPAVGGCAIRDSINGQVEGFAGGEVSLQTWRVVAGEASLVVYALSNRGGILGVGRGVFKSNQDPN